MKIDAKILSIILIFVSGVGAMRAQDPSYTIGDNHYAGYSVNDLDTVSTLNGNVVWHIPLYSLKQKGNLPLTFSLSGNSVNLTQSVTCQPGILGEGDSYDPCGFKSVSIGFGVQCTGGFGFVSDQDFGLCRTAHPEAEYTTDGTGGYPRVARTVMFPSWAGVRGGTDTVDLFQDYNDPTKLRSTDGSGITVIPSSAVFNDQDDTPDPGGVPAPYDVYDKNGNLSHFTSVSFGTGYGAGTAIVETQRLDSNGNSIQRGHVGPDPARFYYQDSLGRIFVDGPRDLALSTPSSGNTSLCPSTAALYQPAYYSYTWSVPGPNGNVSYLFCYASVLVRTSQFPGPPGECVSYPSETGDEIDCDLNASIGVLQSVTLPDGTSWKFEYDAANPNDPNSTSYGNLTKLITPQGGSITYTYSGDSPGQGISLAVATRTVDDGLGHINTWQYHIGDTRSTPDSAATTYTTRVVAPVQAGETVPNETVYVFGSPENLAGFTPSIEIERRTYQGSASSGVLLEDVIRTYQHVIAPFTFLNAPRYASLLPSTVSTTHQGFTSSVTDVAYDSGFTAMQSECYRPAAPPVNPQYTCGPYYSASGNGQSIATSQVPFGLPKNVYYTNYADYPNKSVQTSYKWESSNSYLSANLLGLVSSTTVGDDTDSAVTTYGYDEPGNPQGARGNITSVSQTGTKGGSMSTSAIYDSSGRVIKSFDGKMNETDYAYNDPASGEATTITRPPTNGVVHSDSYTYSSSNGQVFSHTDENGNPTYFTYNDPLGRLTKKAVVMANAQQATETIDYSVPRTYTVRQDKDQSGDGLISTTTTVDGIGRSVSTTGPDGNITDIVYEPSGAIASQSNPHVPGVSTSDITSFGYDGLGRKTSQTDSDRTTVETWTYSGNMTDYAIGSTHYWQQQSDGFGKLTDVYEDPNGANLHTSYSYDFLGNLTSVNQQGKMRQFAYDSLSRLSASCNPEALPAGEICDGVSNWSQLYGYDLNGNLQAKTDARNITTTYLYDALNRLISKAYTHGTPPVSDGTPTSCYLFDTASGGIGRLGSEWTQSAAAGACGTSVPGSPKTLHSILLYDAMGRVLQDQRCTGGGCSSSPQVLRPMTYTYNLAGNPTSSSDGVGSRSFVTQYDSAGRLFNFTAGMPGSATPLVTVQSYSPYGLTESTIGSSMTLSKTYDSRTRLTGETVMIP